MNSFQNEAIKTTCWQTIVSSAESFTSFSTRKFCVFRNGPRGGLFLSCDWHFAVFPATVNQSLKANFTHDRTVDSSNLSYVPKGQNKTAAGSGCFYWNHRQWCVCSLCPFISKCISWMCVCVCDCMCMGPWYMAIYSNKSNAAVKPLIQRERHILAVDAIFLYVNFL